MFLQSEFRQLKRNGESATNYIANELYRSSYFENWPRGGFWSYAPVRELNVAPGSGFICSAAVFSPAGFEGFNVALRSLARQLSVVWM